MSNKIAAHWVRADIAVAACALLAAAAIPIATAPEGAIGHGLFGVSSDVVLTSGAADISDIGSAALAADPGGLFDVGGFLQAELSAAEDIFNAIVGLPGKLFSDVFSDGIFAALSDVFALHFGEAFSAMAGIPLAVFEDIVNVPLTVGETAYQMALTIPGEFFFNF
ncbi:MAG TPA: hypothetical protein VFQ37_05695 [Mycobacterium sp.]|nr:hypothetical protein [Mycobacterium sp.]